MIVNRNCNISLLIKLNIKNITNKKQQSGQNYLRLEAD